MIAHPWMAKRFLFILRLSCLLVLLRQGRTTLFSTGIAPKGPDSVCCVLLPPSGVGTDGLSHCSLLAKESAEVAEELIQLEVVHGLMVAVGNLAHVASQRHASTSLEVSMVVHGSRHHSMESAPRAPEQKGFLHCELLPKHSSHKGKSDTSFREELCFPSCLPPFCHPPHIQCWPSHLCSTHRLDRGSKYRAKGLTKTICLGWGSSTEL